jgi:sec-independent protein translocase protein TatA
LAPGTIEFAELETMGIGNMGFLEWGIVLLIVVLIFGTKRLKTIGGDLGGAIKGFKRSMKDDDVPPKEDPKSLDNGTEPDAEFPEQKDKSRRA